MFHNFIKVFKIQLFHTGLEVATKAVDNETDKSNILALSLWGFYFSEKKMADELDVEAMLEAPYKKEIHSSRVSTFHLWEFHFINIVRNMINQIICFCDQFDFTPRRKEIQNVREIKWKKYFHPSCFSETFYKFFLSFKFHLCILI